MSLWLAKYHCFRGGVTPSLKIQGEVTPQHPPLRSAPATHPKYCQRRSYRILGELEHWTHQNIPHHFAIERSKKNYKSPPVQRHLLTALRSLIWAVVFPLPLRALAAPTLLFQAFHHHPSALHLIMVIYPQGEFVKITENTYFKCTYLLKSHYTVKKFLFPCVYISNLSGFLISTS